jgi:hypothetical protein
VGVSERRFGFRRVLQHVAVCLQAVVADLRRVLGKERMRARCVRDAGFDLAARVRQVLVEWNADAYVERTPRWNARRPIAADDLADVQVQRVMHVSEMRIGAAAFIPAFLQRMQCLHQAIGGFDRIRAAAGFAHVHRLAAHVDLEPDHADLGAHHLIPHRLRNQRGVRAIATCDARQRAVAGAFFLDHRLHVDFGCRRQADAIERVEREQIGGDPGFHIAGPAPVKPAGVLAGLERRRAPHVERADRHHVHVAV